MAEIIGNLFRTSLASGMTDIQMTLPASLAIPTRLQGGSFRVCVGTAADIESGVAEIMLVTGTASPWTVIARGLEGRAQVPHNTGEIVLHAVTAGSLQTMAPIPSLDHYGIVKDGVTDNADRIVDAIDDIPAQGGMLIIPQGRIFSSAGLGEFFKPVHIMGYAAGVGQSLIALGHDGASQIILPSGMHGVTFRAGPAGGQSSYSRISGVYFKAPRAATVDTDADGVRIRAMGVVVQSCMVEGFRDAYQSDTNGDDNSNMSSLLAAACYLPRRDGFHLTGTNSNCFSLMSCNANNAGRYGYLTGGPARPGGVGPSNPHGGFCNSLMACHAAFCEEGGFFDDAGGNTYVGPYVEDTPDFPNATRFIIGQNSQRGNFIGAGFSSPRIEFVAPNSEALCAWFIRNTDPFGGTAAQSGRPVVAGSKGGNAALASLLTVLNRVGIVNDTTT